MSLGWVPALPEARVLLVCECGVIANGMAGARCGRDMRTNIRSECPARWEHWQRLQTLREEDR